MDMDQEITGLEEQRRTVATLRAALAERELGSRILRTTLEACLRTGDGENVPRNKGDAEKEAKVHPEYLAYERETIELGRACAIEEAVAESKRLRIQASIAVVGI